MAAKTISIDREAYYRLIQAKHKGESFSQTINRLLPIPVAPVPFNWDAWVKKLETNPASESFIRAVEERLKNRRRPLGRRR